MDSINKSCQASRPISYRFPKSLPLRNIVTSAVLDFLVGDDWFRIQSAGGITADIVHPEDAFLCRIEAPKQNDIVQLSCGRVDSFIADSLFSPQQDLAIQFKGSNLRITWNESNQKYTLHSDGPVVIRIKKEFYRTQRGFKFYQPLDKTEFSRAPSGWCSWYYYYLAVDEKGILRNVAWLKKHLQPFGLNYVQIDDGWQGRGDGQGDNRDWLVTCSAKFPSGMKKLATTIRHAGFIPGIWLIPFTQSNPELFNKNRDLFILDKPGKSIGEMSKPQEWMERNPELCCDWCGRYWFDATNPKTISYLKKLFRMVGKQWGYDYIKIDGQGSVVSVYKKYRTRLSNPQMPADTAYRAGLLAIREGMGKNRFLLNCAKGWDAGQLCQGMRIGGDVGANLDGFESAIQSTMQWLYLNHIVWWTDPDVVCVREPLTLEQARAWVTLVSITGQMLMTSDDMPALDANRVELLRRAYPPADIRPMELYALQNKPSIFDLKLNKPGVGTWDVVAVFNWSWHFQRKGPLSPKRLGIPDSKHGYIFFDVWNQKLISTGTNEIELVIPPMSCRVISIRKCKKHPQFIGSNRHLTQGADDIISLDWNDTTKTLSGKVNVVAGNPYQIYFSIPKGWSIISQKAQIDDGIGNITLKSVKNKAMKWKVKFK